MLGTVKSAVSASMAGAALIVTTGLTVPADAADDFGQHVRTCAQSTGLDGQMNPGMHQGFSGSDPSMTC